MIAKTLAIALAIVVTLVSAAPAPVYAKKPAGSKTVVLGCNTKSGTKKMVPLSVIYRKDGTKKPKSPWVEIQVGQACNKTAGQHDSTSQGNSNGQGNANGQNGSSGSNANLDPGTPRTDVPACDKPAGKHEPKKCPK